MSDNSYRDALTECSLPDIVEDKYDWSLASVSDSDAVKSFSKLMHRLCELMDTVSTKENAECDFHLVYEDVLDFVSTTWLLIRKYRSILLKEFKEKSNE